MGRLDTPVGMTAYLPRWTAQVRADAGSRDPLGLSAHAHELTDELLPGITVQTFWARYYAIYCWILWHIGEVEKPTTATDNDGAFMRREAAFALGTRLGGTRFHGIDNTSERVDAGQDPVDLEFRVLSSSRYGAFGAHYAGSMHTLGLYHRPTPIRDEPTRGMAVKLALAVEATLAGTPFHVKQLWTRPRIARADLEASAPRLSLAAIERPECAEERRLLVDLMFGFECPGNRGQRPRSLALLLWIVEQYEQAGVVCPADGDADFRETCLLYAPLYYGVMGVHAAQKVELPAVPAPLAACADRWQRFCAHQYWTVVQEWLFANLLATLRGNPDGLTLRAVADEWLAGGLISALERRTTSAASHPTALVSAVLDPASYAFGGPLSESALCADAEMPEAALLGILVLYNRWFMPAERAARLAANDPRLQVARIAERWRDPGLSWSQALADLLERQIVRPHNQLMERKRLPGSPWLAQAGERHVFLQESGYSFRNARIAPAVHILRDLGLVARRPERDALVITDEGRAILARVLEVQS